MTADAALVRQPHSYSDYFAFQIETDVAAAAVADQILIIEIEKSSKVVAVGQKRNFVAVDVDAAEM